MVIDITALGFSEDYQQAQTLLDTLTDQCADLRTRLTDLLDVVRPSLRNRYLMALGKKEYKLFALKVKILQLKREIALYQSAVNKGEKLPETNVQTILQQEFLNYQQQLHQKQQELREEERKFIAPKYSQEETEELKKLYHQMVKKLHPDLNPNQTPQEQFYWNKILLAHQNGDWDTLKLMADMANEFLNEKKQNLDIPNSMQELQERIQKLTSLKNNLEKNIQKTLHEPPFTYLELLDNPQKLLARRQELDQQARQLEQQVNTLEQLRNQTRQQAQP